MHFSCQLSYIQTFNIAELPFEQQDVKADQVIDSLPWQPIDVRERNKRS